MGYRSCRPGCDRFLLAFFLVAVLALPVWGQGLDLAPSNPVGVPGTTGGLPQGSNSFCLNSGMFRGLLPPIPNLEIGYLYSFGERVSTGRLTFDFVLPGGLGTTGAAYGEAHGEFANFWKSLQRGLGGGTGTLDGVSDRIDLSFGGGYRRIFGDTLLLGGNCFYDTSRLDAGRWYGSAGVGLEAAGLGPGSSLVDLNFNYYGNLFQGQNSIVNAFRNGPGNFDVEFGYSLELGDYGPDLRVKVTGYKFDVGTAVYGWNAGAEVTSRNGMFSVRAEAGRDRINHRYYTVGGFVNVGIQLDRLLSGQSPFTAPEPIFRSPRNLRRLLSRPAKRNFHQPSAVMIARSQGITSAQGGGPALPNFVVTLTGNPEGSYTYSQDSESTATWTVGVSGWTNANDPCNAGNTNFTSSTSYSVSLAGDTSGLTFPLTADVTPLPDGANPWNWILVTQAGGCANLGLAQTLTFNTAADVITINGSGFNRFRVTVASPSSGTTRGTIVLSATGANAGLVQVLTILVTE